MLVTLKLESNWRLTQDFTAHPYDLNVLIMHLRAEAPPHTVILDRKFGVYQLHGSIDERYPQSLRIHGDIVP